MGNVFIFYYCSRKFASNKFVCIKIFITKKSQLKRGLKISQEMYVESSWIWQTYGSNPTCRLHIYLMNGPICRSICIDHWSINLSSLYWLICRLVFMNLLLWVDMKWSLVDLRLCRVCFDLYAISYVEFTIHILTRRVKIFKLKFRLSDDWNNTNGFILPIHGCVEFYSTCGVELLLLF